MIFFKSFFLDFFYRFFLLNINIFYTYLRADFPFEGCASVEGGEGSGVSLPGLIVIKCKTNAPMTFLIAMFLSQLFVKNQNTLMQTGKT